MSTPAKEYVYILHNSFIPFVYKIGWTNRTPQVRANEISRGTGVVGKWKVAHFWLVSDGYWLEQRIFEKYKQYRLPQSEMFHFGGYAVEQIADQISQFINNNGESPKRAAEIMERQYQEELRKMEAQNTYDKECRKIKNEIDQYINSLAQIEIQPKLKKGFYESIISCIILGCVVGLFASHIIGWGIFGAIVGYFIYVFDKKTAESNAKNKYLIYQNLPDNLDKLKKIRDDVLNNKV